MSLLGPALLSLLAAPMSGAPIDGLRPGQRFELTSLSQSYDSNTGVFHADGNAVLRTDNMSLRADSVVYDQKAQRAHAQGHVLLVGDMGAAFADQVVVDLETQSATLDDAMFLQKSGVSPEQLAQAQSVEALHQLGQTELALTAKRLERIGPRELRVHGLAFTPCDCDLLHPSWRIRASSADVEPGDRAILRWPVVYVRSVPVLAFPYLDLPLSSRRTGFLVPRPSFTALNGFSIEQPIFVTLGRSYDLTFTPGYFTGGTGVYGLQGPRLHTEFRYAPVEGTWGRVGLGLIYDLRGDRDPRSPGVVLADSTRGLREDLRIEHTGTTGSFGHRADVSWASDAYLPKDLVSDVIARENAYLRSTAVVERRFTDAYLGLNTILRQNLQWGFRTVGDDLDPITGTPVAGPITLQQLPAVLLSVPERPVGGPLRVGAEVSYTRIAPLSQTFADEGPDGYFAPFLIDPGQSDGVFQREGPGLPGESEGRDRFSVRPSVSIPLDWGPLRAVPAFAYRSDVWVGEATGRIFQRTYPVLGIQLSTEASRVFAQTDGGVRHVVVPELAFRTVPWVYGLGVLRPYDAADAAVPHDGFWDAVVQLRQSLWVKRNGQISELLRFDVGQGLDLGAERLADSFVRMGLHLQSLSLSGTARYEPSGHRLDLVSLVGNLELPHGVGLSSGYDNLLTTGSDLQRTRLERLVGDLPPPGASRAQLVTLGARAQVGAGFGLRYDLQLQPGSIFTPFVAQTLTALYAPACNCWTLGAYGRLQRQTTVQANGDPAARLVLDFGATLSISGFGSFGSGSP